MINTQITPSLLDTFHLLTVDSKEVRFCFDKKKVAIELTERGSRMFDIVSLFSLMFQLVQS